MFTMFPETILGSLEEA